MVYYAHEPSDTHPGPPPPHPLASLVRRPVPHQRQLLLRGRACPVTQTTAQQLASQARKAREALLRRDNLIRQMRDEGATLRAIGEAAGLSHMGIRKILGR